MGLCWQTTEETPHWNFELVQDDPVDLLDLVAAHVSLLGINDFKCLVSEGSAMWHEPSSSEFGEFKINRVMHYFLLGLGQHLHDRHKPKLVGN